VLRLQAEPHFVRQLAAMAGFDLRSLFTLILAIAVTRYFFHVPPMLILVTLGILLCLVRGNEPPGGGEQVEPVYEGGVADGLRWGASAIQGRRPYMEDMFLVRASFAQGGDESGAVQVGLTHFITVFDGHGGKRAAEWAHRNLLNRLLAKIIEERTPGTEQDAAARAALLDSACTRAFVETDGDFLKYAARSAIPDGSTCVSCMVQRGSSAGERSLLVANLGDSRAALVRRDGSAVALSSDHKPNRPDEKARVEAAGGHVIWAGCWRVQGDLAVSRAFGDSHLKRFGVSATPELGRFSLTANDAFLVLASDGLWDVVDEAQCAKTVLLARDPKEAARALTDLASAKGSMDNITAVVVSLAAA